MNPVSRYFRWLRNPHQVHFFKDAFICVKARQDLEKQLRGKYPGSAEALAKDLGFEVVYTPELGDKVGGMLIPGNGNSDTIAINSDKSPEFREFSIAHELAHAYLGHAADTELGEGRREQQATFFAMILLQKIYPGISFREYLRENPDYLEMAFFISLCGIYVRADGNPLLWIPGILKHWFTFLWKAPSPRRNPEIKESPK